MNDNKLENLCNQIVEYILPKFSDLSIKVPFLGKQNGKE